MPTSSLTGSAVGSACCSRFSMFPVAAPHSTSSACLHSSSPTPSAAVRYIVGDIGAVPREVQLRGLPVPAKFVQLRPTPENELDVVRVHTAGLHAQLQLALLNLAVQQAVANGFQVMITPPLVRPEIMGGTGFLGPHTSEVYKLAGFRAEAEAEQALARGEHLLAMTTRHEHHTRSVGL